MSAKFACKVASDSGGAAAQFCSTIWTHRRWFDPGLRAAATTVLLWRVTTWVESVEDNPIRSQILDKATRWRPHDGLVVRRYVDIQELFDDDESFLCFHLGLQSSDGTSFGKVVWKCPFSPPKWCASPQVHGRGPGDGGSAENVTLHCIASVWRNIKYKMYL